MAKIHLTPNPNKILLEAEETHSISTEVIHSVEVDLSNSSSISTDLPISYEFYHWDKIYKHNRTCVGKRNC